jgi:pyruvate dehydrogenase E2 component (dihydrolipoamide acetyltransferase)
MAEFFNMPQASPTMEAGAILKWRKQEGERLKPQDVIAEVETDKAAMEVEVFDEVVLLKILVPAGQEAKVFSPIAILGKRADEDYSALLATFGGGAPTPIPVIAPTPTPESPRGEPARVEPARPEATKVAAGGLQNPAWMGQVIDPSLMEMPTWNLATPDAPGEAIAAPAARRAALARGIELNQITGTGPRGRILRADVEAAGQTPRPTPVAAAPIPSGVQVKNSQMRKTIAKRLSQAWNEAPAFYLTAVFDCERLVAFREQLKEAGIKASYNDLLIKCCGRALRDVPEVNASWGEDAITRHTGVHIGVAVALPDGLITPVIRDADRRGVGEIADAMRDLATRAKDRKLKPEEYTGSTFSISNLGMMGIEQFTAILNPPEALILAVGAMQREPVVDTKGALAIGWRMRVTLTCDHRVVDGALGARFLEQVRRYIEHPALLST